MKKKEMEDLLWDHPDKFFNEPLTQFRRQPSSHVGRADLVFKDRLDRLLVVEVKRGKLERGAIDQLLDYFGMLKREFPDKPVELMVVASSIPEERRLACEKHDISCFEISEKKYRDVASEVGYEIVSEKGSLSQHGVSTLQGARADDAMIQPRVHSKTEKAWGYLQTANGRNYVLAFVNQKGNCSMRTFDSDGFFLSRQYGDGDYQIAFKDHYQQAKPLTLSHQPNLERACRERLPDWVLSEIRQQLPTVEAASAA